MKSEKQLGEPGSKLFVGNIPPNCTEQDLAQLCKEHGNVVRADIVKNFAFVIYETKEEAQKAISVLDGFVFQDVELSVQIAKSKLHVDGKDDNQCYECGQSGHRARECPKRIAKGGRRGSSSEQDHYKAPPPRDSHYSRSPPSGGYDEYSRRGEYGRSYERPPPPRYEYDDRRPPVHYPLPYRDRSRSPPRYDYPPSRSLDPYSRDPYARDPYARDSLYARDLYARDLYAKDSYLRDAYLRERYRSDPRDYDYARDPYSSRSDPYASYRTPPDSYSSAKRIQIGAA